MNHKPDPVIDVFVETDPAGTVSLSGPGGSVRMIPFRGTVSGLINGIVEPCGVDTQVTNQAEVRHMSARYMLTGRDTSGAECHVYVENNGWFTDGAQPRPFTTVPTFITDSPVLAPYLHSRRFLGKGVRDEKGLHILFYEVDPQ